ncbi:hypothetical protein CBL_06795 [Carabus blaptoides fortunei]
MDEWYGSTSASVTYSQDGFFLLQIATDVVFMLEIAERRRMYMMSPLAIVIWRECRRISTSTGPLGKMISSHKINIRKFTNNSDHPYVDVFDYLAGTCTLAHGHCQFLVSFLPVKRKFKIPSILEQAVFEIEPDA